MKRIHNYILLSVLLFAAVGCSNDGFTSETLSPGYGNDVQLGLSLPETKTIYGPETTNEKGGKVFPIYWSLNDKVLVASPQCSRTSAEYEVTPVSKESYAEALTRTGDYGVQWGNTDADFYSVYPSKNASWQTLAAEEVVAKLNIGAEQKANLVLDGNVYGAADMDHVIMYAYTPNVKNGTLVNLHYKPFSTVIEFELGIGQNNNSWGSAKVVSMTLTAPTGTNIAGDFKLQFNGNNAPIIEPVGNNSNSIKMDFTTQPTIKQNVSLKAKFALIPDADITDINGWTVTVEVIEGNETTVNSYKKTLTGTAKFATGKIHKIKLPLLTPAAEWSYDTKNWITSLYNYKPIYLTELSLPGAWYAGAPTDDGYQSTADISTLWNAGVRAFAVECRTSSENTGSFFNPTYTPSSVVISGTQNNTLLGSHCTGGTQIRSVIKSIADKVANSEEFAVLVLSYADGGSDGHRDADHNYFINGVKTEIANSGAASNIYTGTVDQNTTIENVLKKLIIKINVDDRTLKSSYSNDAAMLLSYTPVLAQLPAGTDYTIPLFSKIYWKEWADSYRATTTTTTDFLWCFSSTNRTQVDTGTDTSIPTYAQRKAALRGMIEHSKDLTDNGAHNMWFYFNAGGTQTASATAGNTDAISFASTMNAWLLDVVKLKANGGTDTNGVLGTAGAYIESDPSPLGIVMFNQCTNTTYNGPAIIKEIIEMNDKFKLLHAPNTVSEPAVKSAAPGYSSGMTDNNTNAIGWE